MTTASKYHVLRDCINTERRIKRIIKKLWDFNEKIFLILSKASGFLKHLQFQADVNK